MLNVIDYQPHMVQFGFAFVLWVLYALAKLWDKHLSDRADQILANMAKSE